MAICKDCKSKGVVERKDTLHIRVDSIEVCSNCHQRFWTKTGEKADNS